MLKGIMDPAWIREAGRFKLHRCACGRPHKRRGWHVNGSPDCDGGSRIMRWPRSAGPFAACEVHGPESVVKALTPDLLSMVGRALIRRGEILFHVDVTDGRLRLFPVASHDISGDHDPATWKYRVNLAGPDYQTSIENVASDNIVHAYVRALTLKGPGLRLRGQCRSPCLAGRLSASTAAALADEASGPTGSPSYAHAEGCGRLHDRRFAGRTSRAANGGMLTVESHGRAVEKSGEAPPSDWRQAALSALPPPIP